MIDRLICQRSDNKQFVTIATKKGFQTNFLQNNIDNRGRSPSSLLRGEVYIIQHQWCIFILDSCSKWKNSNKNPNGKSSTFQLYANIACCKNLIKLWNTSAVTEKFQFAPDVKFTQPEFPLIKLDKFVHSHLNLFICLSFLFFLNQTFLLKPARKTIDFFFSFCKFCLRFILPRPEFSS